MNKQCLYKSGQFGLALVLAFSLSVTTAPAFSASANPSIPNNTLPVLPATSGRTIIRRSIGLGTGDQPGTPPVDPATPPLAVSGQVPAGAQQTADGTWFMPEGAMAVMGTSAAAPLSPNEAPLSTGGPDEFGYTWDDGVALNWIDTSSGVNTGLTGYSTNQADGPVSLPFTFKYYENIYSSLYIAASGYLSFTDYSGNWQDQQWIPSPIPPNNVIAPYWSPFYIGTDSWVHYQSGGSAPNRYFVIEWHDVHGGLPFSTIGKSDKYRFETILYENGNIAFQYQSMAYNGSYWCGAAGMEDSAGLPGFSTLVSCHQAPSDKAVLFTRPAPSARIRIWPSDQGQFSQAEAQNSFTVPVHNYGDIGTDTFNLDISSSWPASMYAADGVTLLADTDADGKPDTGPLAQGVTAPVIVKIAVPSTVVPGDSNTVVLSVTSVLNNALSKTITLKNAIPTSFVQQYIDDSTGGVSLDLVQSHGQSAEKVSSDFYWPYDPAIATAGAGNFIYVVRDLAFSKGREHFNIEYTLLDHAGNIIKPVTKLTSNSGGVFDGQPAVATTPDGNIGILWTRQTYNSNYSLFNYNVFFSIISGTGKKVLGPTNITNNSLWGNYSSLDVPSYSSPHLAVTGDNRFILAWEDDRQESAGSADNVYYTARSSKGVQVAPVTQLTSAIPGDTNYIQPKLASLTSNRAFISLVRRQWSIDAVEYAILASDGSIVKGLTDLSTGDGLVNWNNDDAVQLPNGNILAVWESWACFPGEWAGRLTYALLDNSYNRIGAPQCLNKPSPSSLGDRGASVTVSGSNYGVITWNDSQGQHLNYALLDDTGNIIIQPMIFLSPRLSWVSITSSYLGYGNAVYDPIPPLANDDFSTPGVISAIPFTNVQSTTLATSASDDPQASDCNLGPGLASVWYQFTPSVDLSLYVDTLGSSYDTILAVWTGTRGSLSPVTCNNDSAGTLQSVVRAFMTAGTTYYIEAAQYNGNFQAAQSIGLMDPLMVGGGLQIHAMQIPILDSPPDGTSLDQNRPTFEWEDVPGATKYMIQIGKDPAFSKLAGKATVTQSPYIPKNFLPANTTLYWRVAAVFSKTSGPWSSYNTFHTANPPSTPVLLSPKNNSTVTGYTPTLLWKISTLPASTVFAYYQVQVATSADFSAPSLVADDTTLTDINVPQYITPTLASATTFYWRVRAVNTVASDHNFSDWSKVSIFKTK